MQNIDKVIEFPVDSEKPFSNERVKNYCQNLFNSFLTDTLEQHHQLILKLRKEFIQGEQLRKNYIQIQGESKESFEMAHLTMKTWQKNRAIALHNTKRIYKKLQQLQSVATQKDYAKASFFDLWERVEYLQGKKKYTQSLKRMKSKAWLRENKIEKEPERELICIYTIDENGEDKKYAFAYRSRKISFQDAAKRLLAAGIQFRLINQISDAKQVQLTVGKAE